MTKTEEILLRDMDVCAGCGGRATLVKLSYRVEGRCDEAYPDFAWRSLCAECDADRKEIFDGNELLDWEEIAKQLYAIATPNGSHCLLKTIEQAQSRTVDVGIIIQVIEGIGLIPVVEL